MPNPGNNMTLEDFRQLNQAQQNAVLDQNYKDKMKTDLKLSNKTLSAQKGKLDKLLLAAYYGIRATADSTGVLSMEDRFNLGIASYKLDKVDEAKQQKKFVENAIHSIVDPPSLESMRDLYFLVGMTNAWSSLQIGRENELYQKKAREVMNTHGPVDPNNYTMVGGRDLTEQLGDLMTMQSESMAHQIFRSTKDDILSGMQDLVVPGSVSPEAPEGKPYKDLMYELLRQELKQRLQPPENPTLTAGAYMDLVKMDPATREKFLKGTHLKPEDDYFAAVVRNMLDHKPVAVQRRERAMEREKRSAEKLKEELKKFDQNSPEYPTMKESAERAEAVYKQAEAAYKAAVHEAAVDDMMELYVSHVKKSWLDEGAAAFEKGLQESDKKELRNGRRLEAMMEKGKDKILANLKKNNVDHEAVIDQVKRENVIKNFKATDELIRGGKPLYIRRQYGYSEAIYADNPKAFAERADLTGGVLTQLEEMKSTWKYHSKDSTAYTKFLNSLRSYRDALRSKEGGKVNDYRSAFIKACSDYVKGKESLRSHPNAQLRFDLAMAMLKKELKPEAFKRLVDRVNAKRGAADQVSEEYYENKIKRAVNKGRHDAEIEHGKGKYNVTKASLSGSASIENLDVLCGYPRQPGEEKALPFAPVGAPEGSKCSLNPKEYSAVVLASSLSSRHSDFNLGDVTVSQAPAAIEEGRQVAEIAFKAYGGKDVPADKIPLAKLLTLGIRKINQELRLRQGVEKECLKESSARMANMLDRDPELKKLALREGLKENELPVLQKQAPGQEAARENAAGQNAVVQDEPLINQV